MDQSNMALPGQSSATDTLVSLSEIVCTEELAHRPWRPPDYKGENRALTLLAHAWARAPKTILQTLADTILEATRADSAGLSLLTTIDGEERFYWPAISGIWRPHVMGGTPRDFGPCGDVLDRNEVMLFTYPEKRYAYLKPVMPPAVECLLVPFSVGGKPVGTIWSVLHDESRKFDAEDQRLLTAIGHFAAAAYEALSRTGDLPLGPLSTEVSESAGEVESERSNPPLSPREIEVVALLASGYSYQETARRLSLTSKTVETYRTRAAQKLGLQSRAELIAYALRNGMLEDSGSS